MKMYQKQKPKQLRGENERKRERGSLKAGEIGERKGGESKPSECVR